jgi:hypothetical protein
MKKKNLVLSVMIVSFAVINQSEVSIKIFDLSGRLVKTLANYEVQLGHTPNNMEYKKYER